MKPFTTTVSKKKTPKRQQVMTLWGDTAKHVIGNNHKRGYITHHIRPFNRDKDIMKEEG